MSDRLSQKRVRMLSLNHEWIEICGIEADGYQLVVIERYMASRFGHR